MFPLPSFIRRMPCRLAFVPVENAYTTLYGNVLSRIQVHLSNRVTLFWIFDQFRCHAAFANDPHNANRTYFGVQQPTFLYNSFLPIFQLIHSPRHLQSIYIG